VRVDEPPNYSTLAINGKFIRLLRSAAGGYYVLPILYGNELVGRMDAKLNRATKTLLIKGFWLENSSTGEDAALVRGPIRFTHFHGVTQLDAQKVSPATLDAAELFTDLGITLI